MTPNAKCQRVLVLDLRLVYVINLVVKRLYIKPVMYTWSLVNRFLIDYTRVLAARRFRRRCAALHYGRGT